MLPTSKFFCLNRAATRRDEDDDDDDDGGGGVTLIEFCYSN